MSVLDLRPERNSAARWRALWLDFVAAARLWQLCWTLAWLDIKLRYRGSLLGPFWLTLSTGVMVASMGLIYATLFHMNLHQYLPFLALSLVLWNFVGALIGDACTAFVQNEGVIRSMRMPFSLHAGRVVIRNVLVLAHNLIVIVVVFVCLRISLHAEALRSLPAFAMWLADAFAASLLLGALCARFRDIPPIVQSIIQIAFFVTPVIWKPELVGPSHQMLLPINPFFSVFEVVRGPLLDELPSRITYVSAVVYSALLIGLSILVFARARPRIAFWI